ncbi:zinc finger protein-like [Tropilaelaps mercedesae]|uniref:Zinc finger protein-like n=1 Tax=Tropilaelaps mercedesae TaxID=418985 RepID=A0A1V9XDW3_9ACAR|nr:zinc finger protein-like [Tropilaelaps mercedesae]
MDDEMSDSEVPTVTETIIEHPIDSEDSKSSATFSHVAIDRNRQSDRNTPHDTEESSAIYDSIGQMTKISAKLMAFDPAKLDWPSYEIILDCFFKANNITDNKTKMSILRSRGGSTVCSILDEAITSKKSDAGRAGIIDELSTEEAIEALRVALHYEDGSATKRLLFFRRVQRSGESIADYIQDLKQLGRACRFPKIRERLRDQLIAGVQSEEIRRRLLAERGELTMRKAFDIAQLWEELISGTTSLMQDFAKLQERVRNLANDEPDEDLAEKCTDPEGEVSGIVHVDVSPVQQDSEDRIVLTGCQGVKEASRRKRGRPRKNQAVERIVIKVSLKDLASSKHSTEEENAANVRASRITNSYRTPRKIKQELPALVDNQNDQEEANLNEGSTTDVVATTAQRRKKRPRPPPDPNIPPKKRGRPLAVPMVPGGKRFKCQYCDYMTNTRQCVKRHEMTHTGEKPHPCRFCPLRFRERQHLQNHERLHTGELPYICEHCGRGFAKSSTLTDHIRTHTREAPHLCEFCGRGFIQKSALNTHVLIHTGRRPHVCSVCQKGFTTSNLLKTHMRIHNETAVFTTQTTTEQPVRQNSAQEEHDRPNQAFCPSLSGSSKATLTSTDMSQRGEAVRCALETMEPRLPLTDSADHTTMLRTMHMMQLAGYGGVQIKAEYGVGVVTPDDGISQEPSQESVETHINEEHSILSNAPEEAEELRLSETARQPTDTAGQVNMPFPGLGPAMPLSLVPPTSLPPPLNSAVPRDSSTVPLVVQPHSLQSDLVPASSIIPW